MEADPGRALACAAMSTLSPDYVAFFRGLEQHNTTAWFDAHRKDYERNVKKPFEALVAAMIARIARLEPDVKIAPKDAISRINKDVRFSKDKTPYNVHLSANISPYGKKNKAWPGFYFQIGTKLAVYGGAYVLEPPDLARVRKAIAKDAAGFARVCKGKAFVKAFGAIQGEKNKVLPPELRAAAEKEPLVLNKQFYFQAELDPKWITSPKLCDELMRFHAAAADATAWLRRAMGG